MVQLALAVAGSYRGRGEPADDLGQVAMVGLLKAVDGYDPARGPGFTAYAVPTIAGEVKRHFRDKCWVLRVLALRCYGDLIQTQLAERLGVSQMHVSRLLTDALRRLRVGLTADG